MESVNFKTIVFPVVAICVCMCVIIIMNFDDVNIHPFLSASPILSNMQINYNDGTCDFIAIFR